MKYAAVFFLLLLLFETFILKNLNGVLRVSHFSYELFSNNNIIIIIIIIIIYYYYLNVLPAFVGRRGAFIVVHR